MEELGELVYQIPCKSCSLHRGTGRFLRLHKKDVENVSRELNTRSIKKRSQSTLSVFTSDTTTENHLIDLEGIKVEARESDRRRHMKKAIWVQKTDAVINGELPHVYDDVILPGCHRY